MPAPTSLPTDSGSRISSIPQRKNFGSQSRWGLSPVLSRRLVAQEIEQQRDDLLRLLLLHPVPGAVEQLTADHAGADLLRAFESARRLVDTPVAHAADEDRGHVNRAPGK